MAEKNDKPGMHVDIDLVRQLAAVLDDTNLTEIEVEDGDRKVRVARTLQAAPQMMQAPAFAPAAPASAPSAAVPAEAAPAAPAANAVKSPMVGTVYLAANPEAKNFVEMMKGVDKPVVINWPTSPDDNAEVAAYLEEHRVPIVMAPGRTLQSVGIR